MVTIGMNYDVRPGKEELFEQKFQQVLASFTKGSGHVATRLYRDVASPGRYLIHSEWDSRESFLAFVRSDAFRAVTEWGREEILVDQPRHRIYGDGAWV